MKSYTKNFEYCWNDSRGYDVEYDEKHNNSAFMFFVHPDAATGAKQPIKVNVLLDSEDEGLSLRKEMLGPDGLWLHSQYSESAYSFEYWEENLSDQPQKYIAPPAESAGIFAIGDDVVFWELDTRGWELNALWQSWVLRMRPVRDAVDGKMIPCSFEFKMPSKVK